MNPILLTDTYKIHHHNMYPAGTTMIYSNFTPRKSRIKGIESVVFFGLQHFMKEYLVKQYNENFFHCDIDDIIKQYNEELPVDTDHIRKLHELGYLPIEIKSLEEGELCPIGVPCFTIKNTHPDFGWLTNYLETLISAMLWQPITSATIAREYKKLISINAIQTTGTSEGSEWLAHDFSVRGMSSIESAITSGMAHLAVGLTGSDNIPAIYQAKKSYNATGLIGASVPATEHSVMCMGTKDDEIGTFRELLNKYPTGLLSVVSDTWDLWKVLTEFLPQLKEEIMSRDGKLVIRPDSGDPVDIICGANISQLQQTRKLSRREAEILPESKGVIELLWDLFGGNITDQGFKVLDSHIGAIYGDSITLERAEQIYTRLRAKGFATTNIVFGVGSFTYQYNTRDTFGFAMKATYGEINGVGQEIFKDPITDDGTKRSKKGLLRIEKTEGKYICLDQQTWEQEQSGFLKTVFLNGKITKEVTLDEVRQTVSQSVHRD